MGIAEICISAKFFTTGILANDAKVLNEFWISLYRFHRRSDLCVKCFILSAKHVFPKLASRLQKDILRIRFGHMSSNGNYPRIFHQ